MKYDNVEDANLYLRRSVIYHKDLVLRVEMVREDFSVQCYDYDSKEIIEFDHVNELTLTPIKLGYMFDETYNLTLYAYRLPRRNWRQGLVGDDVGVRGNNNLRIRFTDPGFSKMVKNIYPSVQDAYQLSKKHKTQFIPFHRSWAINRNGLLQYKTETVGEWSPTEHRLLFAYHYLYELLEEALGNETYRHRSSERSRA